MPYNAAHVLYASQAGIGADKKIETYRSMPFLALETTGAHASISVLPRILFSSQLQAFVEDEILGVRGLFRVANNSWIPFLDTADGLRINLPKRHVGAVIGDEFQHEVSVEQGYGYRILRALPPGSTQFEAGFSMKADEGEVKWSMDLPLGAFQSMLQIREYPNMQVDTGGTRQGEMQTGRSGTKWLTFDNLMIPTNQAMVMTIKGMPRHPAWKKQLPRFVGILCVVMMLGGIVYAVMRPRAAGGDDAKRKTELMNELVEIEKKGPSPIRSAASRS